MTEQTILHAECRNCGQQVKFMVQEEVDDLQDEIARLLKRVSELTKIIETLGGSRFLHRSDLTPQGES